MHLPQLGNYILLNLLYLSARSDEPSLILVDPDPGLARPLDKNDLVLAVG